MVFAIDCPAYIPLVAVERDHSFLQRSLASKVPARLRIRIAYLPPKRSELDNTGDGLTMTPGAERPGIETKSAPMGSAPPAAAAVPAASPAVPDRSRC